MSRNIHCNMRMLFKQVATGDEYAFRLVFDFYKEPFHGTAFKMTRSITIAEEIVQEVFVILWEKRVLVAAAEKPENYVFTILHNCIYAHFRKLARDRQMKSELVQEEEKSDPAEVRLLEKENNAFLEDVISRMPPQQRRIYKLAKQEGWSREEIAQSLKISPNTVKNHLASAIDFLRGNIEKTPSPLF